MITNKTKAGEGGRANEIILSYRSWVIETNGDSVVLRKHSDVKYYDVQYYPTIGTALNKLFEILMQKNAKSGKGAKNMRNLRDAILQTRKEFDNILSLNNFGGENPMGGGTEQ